MKHNYKINYTTSIFVLQLSFQFCREQKDYVGLSFDTISASGPNGAIIHYKPELDTCAAIDPKLLYLCDSGGQYK